MNRNSVYAIGTTNGAVLIPIASSTWVCTQPVTASKNSWMPLGSRTLRWARMKSPSAMRIPPAMRVLRMVSTFHARPKTCHTMWPPTSMLSATGSVLMSALHSSRMPKASEHGNCRSGEHEHLEYREAGEGPETVWAVEQREPQRDDGDESEAHQDFAGELRLLHRFALSLI